MSVAVPYHEVGDDGLSNALGARVALNRYFKVPYKNSLLLSQQSLYVELVRHRFRTTIPLMDPSSVVPAVMQQGKYAQLLTGSTEQWITVSGVMGFGERGEELNSTDVIDSGTIIIDDQYKIYRYSKDNFVWSNQRQYYKLNLDGTLALVSSLIADRVDDLPDIVNDTSGNENTIPQTIISGLEPMLSGLLI